MPPRITARFRRSRDEGEDAIDPRVADLASVELTGVFAAPQWLRDIGFACWMLAGVALVLVAAIGLAALTSTIIVPVVVAAVIAAVLAPVVSFLERYRIKRGLGAALVFLALLVLGVLFAAMVIAGITSEASSLTGALQKAANKIQSGLHDLGVSSSSAESAKQDASSGLSDGFHTLVEGLASGIAALASIAVFVSFTALSLFLLLKDGPAIRAWVERHLGVPAPAARIVVERTLSSLRGYFAGVTVVALFNALVIGLGALIVGVPNAGSIAVVNFVAAYIPFLGAWSAGAFTVLIALGANGTDAAIAMAIIVLLANGALQQIVQPIAMGAALGMHPLAVLIITIGAGALFGTIGMVVAAPLTAAAVRISGDLTARKQLAEADAVGDAEAPQTGLPHEPSGPAPAVG